MGLSERQIEILQYNKMPTELDKLSYSQEKAIDTIEQMFVYLEEKYDGDFSFVEYYGDDNITGEYMVVCPRNGKRADRFNVYKSQDYGFYDDYDNITKRPLYEDKVKEFFDSELEGVRYSVFVKVLNVVNDKIENILDNVEASICVFIELGYEGELEELIDKYVNWYICNTIHCMSNSIGVFIVTKEDLKRCTYDTYEDELLKMNILGKKHCVISEDKKSNVF